MKRRVALFLVQLLLCVTAASAQKIGVGAGLGMANSRMEDLKYFQEQILDTVPVKLGMVSSFPDYATASAGIYYQLYRAVRIGAGYAFTSTGARSNYSDYSGSISTDFLAKSHRLGAYVCYAFLSRDRYDLSVYGRVDANITLLDITHSLYVMGYGDRATTKYISFSPALTGGLEFLVHFRDFSVGVDGGYLADIPGELRNRDTDIKLSDPDDQSRILTSDWTGWRLQAKVLIWFD
jgi:hypothetical protein